MLTGKIHQQNFPSLFSENSDLTDCLYSERKSSLIQPWDLNHRQFSSMSRGGSISPFCISTGETWALEAHLE